MTRDQGIAQRLETAAYDLVYLVHDVVFTFWDYMFRPSKFKRLAVDAKLEGEQAEKLKSPYALPITYAAFAIITLLLYVPAAVGFQPQDYPLLGQTLNERIGFFEGISSAVSGAGLSQIIIMLVPLIIVVSLHAALVKILLGIFRLKTTFETQLGLDFYAGGTYIFVFCIFMSPPLIQVPARAFRMNRGTVGAEDLLIGILALMIASFVVTFLRHVMFVHQSCQAGRKVWWRSSVAVLGATTLSLGILWLLVTFWFPFLIPTS